MTTKSDHIRQIIRNITRKLDTIQSAIESGVLPEVADSTLSSLEYLDSMIGELSDWAKLESQETAKVHS